MQECQPLQLVHKGESLIKRHPADRRIPMHVHLYSVVVVVGLSAQIFVGDTKKLR